MSWLTSDDEDQHGLSFETIREITSRNNQRILLLVKSGGTDEGIRHIAQYLIQKQKCIFR